MKKNLSNSASGSAGRGDGGKHPLLARLPDVSGQQPAKQRSPRAAAAGFVDYRFDAPAGGDAESARGHQNTQPHAFKRLPRPELRTRPSGSPSRALPDSNPFSIPAASLLDKIAPLAHFLVLFVLFTAGWTILMSGRREQASKDPASAQPRSAAAPSSVRPTLEPAAIPDHPTMATPSAFGPLGATAKPSIQYASELAEANPQSEIRNPQSEIESVRTVETTPLPMLASANGEPLPRVRTNDPVIVGVGNDPARLRPPVVARLPGIVLESPARQAQHDNNQPGLH